MRNGGNAVTFPWSFVRLGKDFYDGKDLNICEAMHEGQ